MAKIIDLHDNYEAILSLSGNPVTKDSPTSALRRAYLKISMKVHPDKNGQSSESKNSFQLLVAAYERLSQPELFLEEEGDGSKGPKTMRIARGNHGCFVTRVDCPRCSMEWNKAELGLEKGSYNWFMMAIKMFSCGRCLMEFGCMSGIHKCPHCRKPYEYDPNDYHRKVTCGNPGCLKTFGFWMHEISERRENAVRKEIKKAQEKRLKKREQRGGRAARAAGRRSAAAPPSKSKSKSKSKNKSSGKSSDKSSDNAKQALTEQEGAFVLGLVDSCPRCGRKVRGSNVSETTLREHLENCQDKERHAKFARKKAERLAREEASTSAADRQEEIMLEKQWEYQGSQAGQLWMLSTNSIRKQCELRGLDTEGEQEDLIRRLAPVLRLKEKGRYLTDGSGGGGGARTMAAADDDDLPENLHSMSAKQLLSVAASYGVKIKAKAVKVDIIEALEKARFKGTGMMMLGDAEEDSKKRSRSEEEDEDEDDDDDDDEDDFQSRPKKKKHQATIVISDSDEAAEAEAEDNCGDID